MARKQGCTRRPSAASGQPSPSIETGFDSPTPLALDAAAAAASFARRRQRRLLRSTSALSASASFQKSRREDALPVKNSTLTADGLSSSGAAADPTLPTVTGPAASDRAPAAASALARTVGSVTQMRKLIVGCGDSNRLGDPVAEPSSSASTWLVPALPFCTGCASGGTLGRFAGGSGPTEALSRNTSPTPAADPDVIEGVEFDKRTHMVGGTPWRSLASTNPAHPASTNSDTRRQISAGELQHSGGTSNSRTLRRVSGWRRAITCQRGRVEGVAAR